MERGELQKDTRGKDKGFFFFLNDFPRYKLDNCEGLGDSEKLSGKTFGASKGEGADLLSGQ